MKLIHSKQGIDAKPANAAPFQQPCNYVWDEVSVKEFAELCCNGYTFRAGYYPEDTASFKQANCIGVNLFALDFDGLETTPDEMCEYAAQLGLPASFYYYSFSQNPVKIPDEKNGNDTTALYIYNNRSNTLPIFESNLKDGMRYRIVWVLEDMVSHKEAKATIQVLMSLFPQCDKACKDVSRLFYGGSTVSVVLNEKPISLASVGWLEVAEKVKQGVKPSNIRNAKKGCGHYYIDNPAPEAVSVGTDWMDRLKGRCELWDKWVRQDDMEHNERLVLWSHLRYLKHAHGQTSVVDDVLKFFDYDKWHNEYGHGSIDEEQIRTNFRDTTLKPIHGIVKAAGGYVTIPEFFANNYDEPIKLQENKCDLESLDEWLNNNFVKSLENNKFIYFKSQTASGKTKRIIDYYKMLNKRLEIGKQILAVPTHALAAEVEQRILKEAPGVSVYRIPEITDYTEKELVRLNAGLPAKHKNEERSDVISKLLGKTNGVFILTHSMLVHLEMIAERASRIIIDENIEEALILNIELNKAQLASLEPFCGFIPTAETLVEAIEYIYENCLEDYLENGIAITNLFSILKAEFVKPTANGGARALVKSPVITRAIEWNTPIALFTATPLSARLKAYYGYDFMEVEAPFAANKGKVIQYRGVTGARGINNSKLKGYVDYINQSLPQGVKENAVLISFMGSREIWEEAGFTVATVDDKEIHLRNNAGLDCFKGKDLIVVGKFDLPDEYYLNLWEDTGDGTTPTRVNQVISRNGIRQSLFLWDKPELMEQQLQYMEFATAQAVGRARTLRVDATVYLFSNYVIKDTDIVFD